MTTQHSLLTERVFREYRERIYGYMAGKNVPQSDRDDVFSEILLKTARQAQRYDSAKASVSTWVYTATRSVVSDYFRKRKEEYPLTEALTSDCDVEGGVEYEEELRGLARQLARLPDRERQVIILRLYRDMKYPEIARTMSLSGVNVRKIYSRAIGKLREWMAYEDKR
jgi:RNA polymerase sigma-70 factor (ECF subfamily)